MVVYHIDVESAFLQGILEQEVFMEKAWGCEGAKNKVCFFKKAIYELKQSSRIWYKRVEEVLVKIEFKKSKFKPCVFIKFKKIYLAVVVIYVDDFLTLSNNNTEQQNLKNTLSDAFKMKDLVSVKCYWDQSNGLHFVFIKEIRSS